MHFETVVAAATNVLPSGNCLADCAGSTHGNLYLNGQECKTKCDVGLRFNDDQTCIADCANSLTNKITLDENTVVSDGVCLPRCPHGGALDVELNGHCAEQCDLDTHPFIHATGNANDGTLALSCVASCDQPDFSIHDMTGHHVDSPAGIRHQCRATCLPEHQNVLASPDGSDITRHECHADCSSAIYKLTGDGTPHYMPYYQNGYDREDGSHAGDAKYCVDLCQGDDMIVNVVGTCAPSATIGHGQVLKADDIVG